MWFRDIMEYYGTVKLKDLLLHVIIWSHSDKILSEKSSGRILNRI